MTSVDLPPSADVPVTTPMVEAAADFFNPFDPAFRADPWPAYRRLREEAPVHRNAFGALVFARYGDCAQLLRDPRLGKDILRSNLIRAVLDAGGTPPFLGLGLDSESKPFLLSDPPHHTRLRGLVSAAFTPRVVERMRPAIATVVNDRLDGVAQAREWDAVADLGYEMPLRVLGDLLGVPPEDRREFRSWSGTVAEMLELDFFIAPEVLERRKAALDAFRDYFQSLLEERSGQRGDDLVSRLLAARDEEDGKLTSGEIVSICILLVIAALETTANLIGNGVLAVSRAPGAWETLRRRPELGESAVEEILRYEPSAHEVGRVALEPFSLGELRLDPGDTVLLLVGSANRDDRRFADPERLNFERRDRGHLTFGLGIHYCLGAPLARMIAKEAFVALPRRLRRIEVAVDAPEYKAGFGLRGPAALPMVSDAS